MKTIITLVLCISIITLAACVKAPNEGDAVAPTTTTTQPDPSGEISDNPPIGVYDSTMSAVSLPLITEVTYSEDKKPIAYYTHQDVLLSLPDADVAGKITLELLNRIDQTRPAAEKMMKTAKSDYEGQSNWYPYSYAITYQPMRLDQNVLSLFGTEASFDGSPRSLHNAISANYDLTTGEALSLRTIFHEENFADTICDLIINGLTGYEKDTLFSDYRSIIRGKFSTNVPVDSWYFSDDGLCFYFAPYEIAPFSAGVVISQISYEALGGLLRDEYFPTEELNYAGSILIQAVPAGDTALLSQFSQFAEVSIEPGTQKLLIYTDGSVSNPRLILSTEPDSGVSEATVLSLAGLGPKDGILVEVSTETAIKNLTISFESFGQLQTLRLQQNESGKLIFSK